MKPFEDWMDDLGYTPQYSIAGNLLYRRKLKVGTLRDKPARDLYAAACRAYVAGRADVYLSSNATKDAYEAGYDAGWEKGSDVILEQ